MADASQCECMDGPNHVDSTCLYCGGTGIYASDERLAELAERYTYLAEHSDEISRRQFKASDQQHVAIFKALQIARADEMRRVRESIGPNQADGIRWVPQAEADWLRQRLEDAEAVIRDFLACPEIADCAPGDLDQETRVLERRARRFLEEVTKE